MNLLPQFFYGMVVIGSLSMVGDGGGCGRGVTNTHTVLTFYYTVLHRITLNYTVLHYTLAFFVYGVIQCSKTPPPR